MFFWLRGDSQGAALDRGEAGNCVMENQPKAKLKWWVDLVLFLVVPVFVAVGALLKFSLLFVGELSLVATVLLSLALAGRLVARLSLSSGRQLLLGFFLTCVLVFVIMVISIFGCSLINEFGVPSHL